MTKIIPTQKDTPTGPKYHVNEYHMDRAYGGPEEGGWWYTTGRFIDRLGTADTIEEARTIEDRHQSEMDELNHGLPSIDSMASQGRNVILIDERPGADFPSERPYYS